MQACNNVQQGGFSAAGGTDNTDKFIVMDIQIDAIEGNHFAVSAFVDLLNAFDLHLGGQISRFSCHAVSLLSKNFRIFSASIPITPTTMM